MRNDGNKHNERATRRHRLGWLQRIAAPVLTALALAVIGPAPHADPVARPCGLGANEHGGGLNGCGCHFNRKTGECHCHRPRACGCECQPGSCPG